MFVILHAVGTFVADLFKSRSRLEAEILFLRHQLNVALRRAPHRVALRSSDRAFMVWMSRLWPSLVCTENVIRIDWLKESPNVMARLSRFYFFLWPFWPRYSSRTGALQQRMQRSDSS